MDSGRSNQGVTRQDSKEIKVNATCLSSVLPYVHREFRYQWKLILKSKISISSEV